MRRTASLNLYSSRHYQTDEALYANFTKQTGIKINRIEAGEDALIERIRNEGARSPADVLITVDAGRLWRAEQLGLFQPVKSAVLDSRIPASFRDPAGDWFGFSMRARVIAYDKTKVKPGEITTYEDLADPRWKGKICSRSGSHIYNLSLMGALIDHLGEAKAEEWAQGGASRTSRATRRAATPTRSRAWPPASASSRSSTPTTGPGSSARTSPTRRCIAEKRRRDHAEPVDLGNAREHLRRRRAEERAATATPRSRFLEYLASDDAQRYFADGNNEWPVVASVQVVEPGARHARPVQGTTR